MSMRDLPVPELSRRLSWNDRRALGGDWRVLAASATTHNAAQRA